MTAACAAPVDRHLLDKTRMCKFFLDGKCHRGKACTFAHSSSELHAPPDLYRSQLCSEFSETGSCRYGTNCRFAHGEEQLRPAPSTTTQHHGAGSETRLKQQLAAVMQQQKALEAQLEALEGTQVASSGWELQECDADWSTAGCWYRQASLDSMDYSGCQGWGDACSWMACMGAGVYSEVFVAAPAPAEAVFPPPPLPWRPSADCDVASEPSTDCGGGDAQVTDSDVAEPSSDVLEEPRVVVRNTFIEYDFGAAAPPARRRARSSPAEGRA